MNLLLSWGFDPAYSKKQTTISSLVQLQYSEMYFSGTLQEHTFEAFYLTL